MTKESLLNTLSKKYSVREISIANIQSGDIVLEIGCGYSYDLVELSRLVGKKGVIIGVDPIREKLYRARGLLMKEKVTNVSLLNYDINKLPIKDGTIDKIICNYSINNEWEREIIFGEIHRVLKEDGQAIISVENPPKNYLDLINRIGLKVIKTFNEPNHQGNNLPSNAVTFNLLKS